MLTATAKKSLNAREGIDRFGTNRLLVGEHQPICKVLMPARALIGLGPNPGGHEGADLFES